MKRKKQELLPAVFHEGEAAAYVGMSKAVFRKKLLFSGRIPYAKHLDGKRRIFLRADLDSYLENPDGHED